jgi:hypothetical protein
MASADRHDDANKKENKSVALMNLLDSIFESLDSHWDLLPRCAHKNFNFGFIHRIGWKGQRQRTTMPVWWERRWCHLGIHPLRPRWSPARWILRVAHGRGPRVGLLVFVQPLWWWWLVEVLTMVTPSAWRGTWRASESLVRGIFYCGIRRWPDMIWWRFLRVHLLFPLLVLLGCPRRGFKDFSVPLILVWWRVPCEGMSGSLRSGRVRSPVILDPLFRWSRSSSPP